MAEFHPRKIMPSLIEHLDRKQVTVITGMRRTGKTTLARQLMALSPIAQKAYFDLERINFREIFSQDNYENIILKLAESGLNFSQKVLLVIDEIQVLPNLPSVVKYLYDHYDVKFILTGSSSYYLKNRFSESLAGRKKIFEVFPLDFSEVLAFKGVPAVSSQPFFERNYSKLDFDRLGHFYEEYIEYGGFPEVVLAETKAAKKDLVSDILSSYMNLDVVSVSDFHRSAEVFKLVKLLAARIGSKIDVSKIANLMNIGRKSVDDYLVLLEQTYLIRTIPVTSNSADREIVKARKLYFLDNGMANFLADLGSGTKFENAVFNQLLHQGEITYYQLKTGKEIDFILDKKMAFEAKETPEKHDLKNLQNTAQNLQIEQCFLIGRHPTPFSENVVWGGNIW